VGLGGVAIAADVSAQATSATPDIKVEVTGSNIRRVEGEGALPVQVIGSKEIAQSGVQNAVELMALISANNTSGNVALTNVIGATTFSNQTASLRGLSGQNTLILINGKRLGTFSGGISGAEGVNLAAIPLSAVERVEVLKTGGSAIYGSDAVGGVINFIMKQDYQGAEATAWFGGPTRSSHGSNGDQWNIQGTAGWGDLAKDKWNAFISASYQEQKPLWQNERNFSNTSYIPDEGVNGTSGQTFPAYISTGGIGSLTFPNCSPNIVVGSRCRFDPSNRDGVESIPETKQTNLFGSGRYQFTPDWQAYVTGMYAHFESEFIIQPVPLSDQIATTSPAAIDGAATIFIPPGSPFYPTDAAIAAGVNGQPLNARWRCFPCGNRDTTDTNDAWQIVAGVKGNYWSWDWDTSFNFSDNTAKEVLNGGFPLYSQILPLLRSGNVNLVGVDNTDAINQQIKATNFNGQTFHSSLPGWGFDFVGSGDIYKLPAGPLALAVGAQYTKATLKQNPNPLLATGDVSGYGGNLVSIDHDRTQYAFFGEFSIPVIQTVEVDAAVRYDHYSDFGNTTNPTIGVRWQPIRELLVRGSWGKGFLAPTLYQLWNPQVPGLSQAGVSDPLRCPDPNAPGAENNPDCNTQYTATFGGNPQLKPETAKQWNLGFVFEPLNGVSIAMDGFKLDVKNQVTNGVSIATILDPATYPLYQDLVTRAATCVGGQPCPIIAIDQRFVNLGETKITGFDIDARFRSPPTDYGTFSAIVTGTYYSQYDVMQPDGSFAGFISNAFGAAATGITPRWKSYIAGTWTYGPWSLTLDNNYVSSYIDVNTNLDGNTRRVGTQSIWDIQGTYTGLKYWTFGVGARNLFDTNPPFTNQNLTFQFGYDPAQYDARGRLVYGFVTFAWK
jgi:iron complex outermembrane receptor protein